MPRALQFLGKRILYVWGTPSYKQPLWYYSHKHLIWEFVTGSVLKSLDTEVARGPLGAGCVHLTQELSISPGWDSHAPPSWGHTDRDVGMSFHLTPCSQYWG